MQITPEALKGLGFSDNGRGEFTHPEDIEVALIRGRWYLVELRDDERVEALEQILGYMVYRGVIPASRFVEVVCEDNAKST